MEIWDLYTKDRELTGETHQRGLPMLKDRYHLVIHLWIFNEDGEMLIQKRAAHLKSKPGIWSMTGGSATKGENSELAMMREAEEEIGLTFNDNSEKWVIKSYVSGPCIVDLWATVLKEGQFDASTFNGSDEVDAIKWVTQQEFKKMLLTDETGGFSEDYLQVLFENERVLELGVKS